MILPSELLTFTAVAYRHKWTNEGEPSSSTKPSEHGIRPYKSVTLLHGARGSVQDGRLEGKRAMRESEMVKRARKFLGGENLTFDAAFETLEPLQQEDQLSLARRVLERMRKKPESISGGVPEREIRGIPIADHLCQQEALLTSKDPELSAAIRHDQALEILRKAFRFIRENSQLPGDAETLGIAGGICKRKWNDLGQIKDLIRAAEFYRRGAENDLKQDPYPHINAAFLEDLLAAAGDQPVERRKPATELRQKIIDELPDKSDWWTVATRAEAFFGLGRYDDATRALEQVAKSERRAPWKLRSMAQLPSLRICTQKCALPRALQGLIRWRTQRSTGSSGRCYQAPRTRSSR
jgi:tetratricopeptide (TPR) repeat protein